MLHRWLLCILPKRLLTAAIGAFAHTAGSRFIIPWYIRKFRIDISEFAMPLHEYPTLSSLFTRQLKPGTRLFDEPGILSPVDATVAAAGVIHSDMVLWVKGARYTTLQLLANATEACRFTGGTFLVLYLSPRDYHRIHMPADGVLTHWTHIPGRLYPVNRHGVDHIPGLYAKNERIVTYIRAASGRSAIVKVGAMGVGSVRTAYPGPPGRTTGRQGVTSGMLGLAMQRGEEVGYFALGSTVIVLWEPGAVGPILVREGDEVKAGQPIAACPHCDE